MKNAFIYTFALLLLTTWGFAQKNDKTQPPEGGQPKDFTLPKKEVVRLDNGLTLVMVPYGSIPKATLRVSIKTGNIDEKENQVWLSDLLADLMEEGSTTKSAQQIADEIAGMGGNLNIGVGVHTTSISSSVLYEFADDAITLMADVLKNPKWPQTELDRLKNDMKRDLSVRMAEPGAQASSAFFAEIYPDHPYGRIFPTDDMITSYSVEDIKQFYDKNFGAHRTTVYVAGNFNSEKVKKAVENSFSDWRRGTATDYRVAEPAMSGEVKIIDRPGAPQSTIYYGLPVIGPSDKDFIALDVSNSLLGGSFASRITSNIREDKGYTYSPYSALDTNYKSGVWYEVADVTTEHTGASLKEIKNEIEKLQTEPPSQEEMVGIINYESGLYVLQNSSPNGIIGQMIFLDIHDLDESFLTDKVRNMHAVTPEKVQEMTQKYIQPENMTLIVVGDKKKIENQIQETIEKPLGQ
ncbi:M16 family metallopeptidase [Pricia sp.]|uniref:M16 family metallopeptidase n=1 Tax=Pricia sp. TaxID=2268138 RepID=UPI0035931681